MADRSLDNEKKQVNEEKKTLNEVVNNLDIVKSLRKQFPEKLGTFDFLSSVISVLERQGFRGKNAFTGTTMLTEEEIDFIKSDDGLDLITNQISDDVSKTQNGIVLVGGVVDDRASFEQQEANDISVEEAGAYFVEAKKEQENQENSMSLEFFSSFEDLKNEFKKMDDDYMDFLNEIFAGNVTVNAEDVDRATRFLEADDYTQGDNNDNNINHKDDEEIGIAVEDRGVYGADATLKPGTLKEIGRPDFSRIEEKIRKAPSAKNFFDEEGIRRLRNAFGVDNIPIEERKLLFSYMQSRDLSEETYRAQSEEFGLTPIEQIPKDTMVSYLKNAENIYLIDQLRELRKRAIKAKRNKEELSLDVDDLMLLLNGLSKDSKRNYGVSQVALSVAETLGIDVKRNSQNAIQIDEIMSKVFTKYKGLVKNSTEYPDSMSELEKIRKLALNGRAKTFEDLKHDLQLSIKRTIENEQSRGASREKPKGVDYKEIDRRTEIAYIDLLAQRSANEVKDLTPEQKKLLYMRARRDVIYDEFLNNSEAFSIEDKMKALALVRYNKNDKYNSDDATRRAFRTMLFSSIKKDEERDANDDGITIKGIILKYRKQYTQKFGDVDAVEPMTVSEIQARINDESVEKWEKLEKTVDAKVTRRRTQINREKLLSIENATVDINYLQMMREATSVEDYMAIAGRGLDRISRDRQAESLEKLIRIHEKFGTTSQSEAIDYNETTERYKLLSQVMDISIILNKDKDKMTDKDWLKLFVYHTDLSNESGEEYKLRQLVEAKIGSINPGFFKKGRVGLVVDPSAFKKIGQAVYGPSVKNLKEIMDNVRQDELEEMKTKLEDLQRPLTQKEKLRMAKKEYKETFLAESNLVSEFRDADASFSIVLDVRLKRTIERLEKLEKEKKGEPLTEEEMEEFHKGLKIFMMNRKIRLLDVRKAKDDYKASSGQSVIMKYLASHERELANVQPDYGDLGFFERSQFNHYDEDYKKLKREIHLESMKQAAVNILSNPDVKKFSIPQASEKMILEALACCIVDSKDQEKDKSIVRDIIKGRTKRKYEGDPDVDKLTQLIPYLDKISKDLIKNGPDGKEIDEKTLIDLYSKKTGRVIKSVEEIANIGYQYSNKQYEEVTSKEIASRSYELHLERWISDIINSDLPNDKKREEMARLTKNIYVTDSRSKVASLFVFGKIERSLSASERSVRPMGTITDELDEVYRGTTALANSNYKRVVDAEKIEGLLHDPEAMANLSSNEKKSISHYIDNGIESEDIKDSFEAVKRFSDFDTFGQDVAKQIFMIKQAELAGPEATQRYMDENPDYDSFLEEGSMDMSISLLRLGALSRLEKGLAEESPTISNAAINTIMHSISYSANYKNIADLALEYAKKFITEEELEGCIVYMDDRRRVNDVKLLNLLEQKLRDEPSVSDEEKHKFEVGNYKQRDVAEELSISAEISQRAKDYLIRSGIKEEDLPMLVEPKVIEKPTEESKEAPLEETGDNVKKEEPVEEAKKGDTEKVKNEISDAEVRENFNPESIVVNSKGEVTAIMGGSSVVPADLVKEGETVSETQETPEATTGITGEEVFENLEADEIVTQENQVQQQENDSASQQKKVESEKKKTADLTKTTDDEPSL